MPCAIEKEAHLSFFGRIVYAFDTIASAIRGKTSTASRAEVVYNLSQLRLLKIHVRTVVKDKKESYLGI